MALEGFKRLSADEELPTVDNSEGIDSSDAYSAPTVERKRKVGRECVRSYRQMKQKRTGRKQTEGSEQLSGVLTSKNRPLKTEYKRCQFIRLIKKMCRELSNLKFSKKFLREYGVTKEENESLLQKLRRIYLDNKEQFDSLKETDTGPATDGKNKGKRAASEQTKERSFNREYCKRFYTHECVREFHSVLVELIYGRIDEVDPAVLSKRFNEFCCFETQHTMECVNKWRNVLKYMKTTVIKDLDLEPFLEASESSEFVIFPDLPDSSGTILQMTNKDNTLQFLEVPDIPDPFEEFNEAAFSAIMK